MRLLCLLMIFLSSISIAQTPAAAIWYQPSMMEEGGPLNVHPLNMTRGRTYFGKIEFYLAYEAEEPFTAPIPANPGWTIEDLQADDYKIFNENISVTSSFSFGSFIYVFYRYTFTLQTPDLLPPPAIQIATGNLNCFFQMTPDILHGYEFQVCYP